MLDFLDPLKKFTVVHFRNMALPIIRDLQVSKVLPIVVGGTHYYIESLLWDILVEDEDAALQDSKCDVVTARADLDELSAWKDYAVSLKKDKFDKLPETARQQAGDLVEKLLDWCKNAIIEAEASIHDMAGPEKAESDVVKVCEKLRGEIVRVREEVRELLQTVRVELGLRPDSEIRRVQEEINKKLHSKLGDVDPETASTLHHNSRRKILRYRNQQAMEEEEEEA